jgi:hypothetical protein
MVSHAPCREDESTQVSPRKTTFHVGGITVLDLGKKDSRKAFTKGKHVYPIGFKSQISYLSYKDPQTKTIYTKYEFFIFLIFK